MLDCFENRVVLKRLSISAAGLYAFTLCSASTRLSQVTALQLTATARNHDRLMLSMSFPNVSRHSAFRPFHPRCEYVTLPTKASTLASLVSIARRDCLWLG